MKSKKIIIILCIIIAALITGGTAGAIILLNDDNPDSTPETDKYTVVWKNGDTVLETDIGVPKGTTPIYDGATPVKAADDQYIYEFSGWSPAVSSVTSDITFVAQFNKAPRTFKVEWKNGDTVIETDLDVPYGTNPVYNGEIPTKESTAQYNFSFKGWSPEISAVTGNVTYVAQFTEELRSYTVTFYAEDGATVLATVSVPYGSAAAYPHEDPKKNGTEANTFIFDKWVTSKNGVDADDLQNVTGDRAVYASFKSFTRLVTVYIVSNNTGYGQVSVNKIDSVPYGSAITVTGNTVTVNNQTVTVQTTDATAQYTYEFINWTADATVGSDTTIIANFSRKLNTYTVVWKNGDTVLETDENVNYGTTPTYNGAVPTKPSDNDNVYTFSGWAPVISSVSGNATYEAQFTSTPNVHTVIFYNEDGVTELGRATVSHGATAEFPNQLPIKESTAQYDYEFDKWVTAIGGNTEAVLTNVTTDINVYASHTSTVRKYTVTFCDWDGTVLTEVEIEYGEAAGNIGNPERTGYRFDKWDKSFDNVTENITVKAVYVKTVCVEFVDYDGSVLYYEYIDYGNSFSNIPSDPTRDGYEFDGWDINDFSTVFEDTTVNAVYTRTYTVVFYDYDGTVLKVENVRTGTSAEAPSNPIREGYTFNGWDVEFNNVIQDLSVTATYVINRYTVKYLDGDGREISRVENVKHGLSVATPDAPEYYFNWNLDVLKGYRFTGWSHSSEKITEDLVIRALYEEEITEPIIVVESTTAPINSSSIPVYVYMCNIEKFYGISLDVKFDNNLQSGGRATVYVNEKFGITDVKDESNTPTYASVVTDAGTYELRWTNGNGFEENGLITILTFNFNNKRYNPGEYVVEILESSYIIDENLTKITPVIISGSVYLGEQ